MIARGSVQECVPLLEIARRRVFISEIERAALKDSTEEIARMISGLIGGMDKRET